MKKLTLMIGFLMLATAPVWSQDQGKSTITVSCGVLPSEDVLSDALLLFVNGMLGEHKNFRIKHAAVFVTYQYHITDRFALGASSGYNRYADINAYPYFDRENHNRRTFTSAVEGTLFWVRRKNFQFYSTAGTGIFIKTITSPMNEKVRRYGPTMHIAPSGIRFGDDVGIFAEFGYGYKGIFNAGLSLKI